MNRTQTILAAILALLLLIGVCACLVASLGAGYFLTSGGPSSPFSDPTPTPRVIRPTPGPTPEATATDGAAEPSLPPPSSTESLSTPSSSTPSAPSSAGPVDTLQTLKEATIPVNDLADLARRLQGVEGVPATLEPPETPLQVGDQRSFWVSNGDTNEHFQVPATLLAVTEHSYFWVQDGLRYDADELQALAEDFESQIYPTDREFFGSERTPGIDGDPHLYILYARDLGRSVGGYFSSVDSYHPQVREYSNGHEMFVFNADNVDFGTEYARAVLAHEFQHMIHWGRDQNETRWLNEGFSDLAILLNGYSTGFHDAAYAANPDLQLNDWPTEEARSAPNYGAAFLFLTYFLDRFGEEASRALVADPENGLESVDQVLQQIGASDPSTGQPVSADDFFMDWAVANYLQDPAAEDGRYAYRSYPSASQPISTEGFDSCPVDLSTRDVRQYGVDYIRLSCDGEYTLSFEGSVQVGVVPAAPHSGDYYFWSNKGDESDMTLTQTFDFSGYSGPLTFTYWTWYDLEKDFDYLYLLASTDGERWEMLQPPSGTDADPTGANYGWGYNGTSGSSGAPQWIQENVDLSAYAGREVQLRFEYVTDASVNGEGFLLDDVAIPEIGYASDFETGEGGWEPAGFVRIQNLLPQSYRLALITFGTETRFEPIAVSPDNTAEIPISFGEEVDEAVLVVAGTARFTRQPAAYRFQVTR